MAVARPVRPYKSAIENRFTVGSRLTAPGRARTDVEGLLGVLEEEEVVARRRHGEADLVDVVQFRAVQTGRPAVPHRSKPH